MTLSLFCTTGEGGELREEKTTILNLHTKFIYQKGTSSQRYQK
jgi:hypothetical protein